MAAADSFPAGWCPLLTDAEVQLLINCDSDMTPHDASTSTPMSETPKKRRKIMRQNTPKSAHKSTAKKPPHDASTSTSMYETPKKPRKIMRQNTPKSAHKSTAKNKSNAFDWSNDALCILKGVINSTPVCEIDSYQKLGLKFKQAWYEHLSVSPPDDEKNWGESVKNALKKRLSHAEENKLNNQIRANCDQTYCEIKFENRRKRRNADGQGTTSSSATSTVSGPLQATDGNKRPARALAKTSSTLP